MSAARPDLLYLAVLLPVLIAGGVLGWWQRRRAAAAALGDSALITRLAGQELTALPRRRLILLAGAAAALGVAAAGPTWGLDREASTGVAADVVLAMDVSRSMLAEDVTPSRLERARLLAAQLVRELRGDRLGLVVFAGRAYTLSPLTVDAGALNLYVNALDPEIVSQGGSSLAAAIRQAADLARGGTVSARDRVVVLITDGEAHDQEDEVLAAAEAAERAGVTVHTVGVGTLQGARIVDQVLPDGRTRWVVGPDGEIVVSRLGQELLSRVAGITGGRYVHLDGGGAATALLRAMGDLERTATGEAGRWVPRDRSGLFIALALVLLALDTWLALPLAPGRGLRWPTLLRRPVTRAGQRALLLVALLVITGAGIGDLERGNRLYREGRWAEAVEAYRAALAEGEASAALHYNLGTALLRLNRFEEADQHLETALRTVEPELRQRALYNLGNRFLEEYRAAPPGSVPPDRLAAAVEAYRRALRLDPDDVDAKWNLELALREQEDAAPQGGAGGQDEEGIGDPQQGQAGPGGTGTGTAGSQAPSSASPGAEGGTPMSREQAERILAAAEQDEAALTRETLRRGQRSTPVRRNW
ncbi:MAG: VWA domain-containing protein [Gemmatimonadota bacterium]